MYGRVKVNDPHIFSSQIWHLQLGILRFLKLQSGEFIQPTFKRKQTNFVPDGLHGGKTTKLMQFQK